MKVIATIQPKFTVLSETEPSYDVESAPVDMTWYTGDDAAQAIAAIAGCIANRAAVYTETLSVRVEF